ncbi:MAG: hypothetical protein QXS60_14070 [Saccharolobus sp.]
MKKKFNEVLKRIENFIKNIRAKNLSSIEGLDEKAELNLPEEYVKHLEEISKKGKHFILYRIPTTEKNAQELKKILEEEKVKFNWLGIEYVPPGLLKLMKEGRLKEQLEIYKRINKRFGINVEEGIIIGTVASDIPKSLIEKAPELLTFIAGRFGSLLQPVSILLGTIISAFIFVKLGENIKRELFKVLFELIDDWGKLDEGLRRITASHIALLLSMHPDQVYDAMENLSNEDVKKEIEKLKEAVNLISLGSGTIVFPQVNGDDLIGLGVYNGKIYEGKNVYNLVTVRFEDIAKEIEKSLIDSKGKDPKYRIFFIVGPKGIGKSTLIHYVIADLLQKNEFTWAVRVSSPNINPWAFRVEGDEVILFYDYYPYEVYTSESPARIGVNVRDVVDVIESLRRIVENHTNAFAIIVLSDDILSSGQEFNLEDFIKDLPQQQVITVDLHFEDFIEGVVKSYSDCSDVGEVAKAIVDNYKGGYTLLAKYAGLWLKGNNCNYGDVKKVLEESKNEPKRFLKKYINTVLEQTTVNWYALPLLIHVFLGEVPIKVSEELPFWLNDETTASDYERYAKAVAPWIATRKEDLMEEVLKEYLEDIILGKNLKEYRKGSVDINILKYYFSTNRKLKDVIKSVYKSIKDYLTELKNAGVNDSDLYVVKAFIGYDEGLWGQAIKDLYAVLKGWASGGNEASDEYETVISTVLIGVIREFLRDKLLGGGQGVDKPTLELLLRLAVWTALLIPAKGLFDEAGEELKEYLFTESHEVPFSIRLAVHGYPPFINGLFNESGGKYVKTVDSSWCEYLKLAEGSEEMRIVEVALGAALYLLSIPEELSDECKEKIIETIKGLQNINIVSIYFIDNAFLRFLVKNNSLNNTSAYKLSTLLANIPAVKKAPYFLRVLLEAGYRFRDKIKDDTLKKIYTIDVICGLIDLGVIDESILGEAESLMSLEDEVLLPSQAALAQSLMNFYLSNKLFTDADKLAERLEKVGESVDKVNWDGVADWFNKKGIKEDKDRLKEETKGFVFFTLAKYYHELLHDIEKEKEYTDAAYDALVKELGGEEEAKENEPNDYFSALVNRDRLNAVLGGDLSKALEVVVKDSEEAFNYSRSIGTAVIRMIIMEYLIASAYLGRLDKALEKVNDNPYLRDPLSSMDSVFLLGLYSLLSYLTGGKFRDKVMEYARRVSNNEVLSFDELTIADRILKDVAEKPMCSRAIIETQRGLVRDLKLKESEASYLIDIFLVTKPGIISLLSLSMFFSGLEVAKGWAECLAEYLSGALVKLLRKVSQANGEEEFRDALVRLAMYLFR